jgi:hypothetical protein
MRWAFAVVFCGTCALCADVQSQDAPIGILRGDLVNWTGRSDAGMLLVTNTSGVYRCGFDSKTYMEREGQRAAVGAFSPGDRVEIVADHRPGSDACYARTVHSVDRPIVRMIPGRRPPLVRGPSPTETWAPRGDMTFSGLVVTVSPELMVIRTRSEGRKEILLRQDTRYLSGGMRVDPGDLQVNTHVFVRAGRNLDDHVEAYQVVWGQIVQP